MRWLALLAVLVASPAWAGLQGVGPVTNSAGASSIAVTAPTVNSAGSCELLAMITNATGGTASLSGWTAQQTCTAGLKQTTFLTKAASGTEGGSYTFALGSSLAITDARIFAFCGVNTTTPVDKMGCANTSVTSPSLTPTGTDEDMLIVWHGGNGVSATAWPTGISQTGVDTTNGGEAAYAALITNASAQSYALTISTASPYSGAIIFNPMSNNRQWGVRSRSVSAFAGSGTSAAFTAPPNIVGSEDRADMFLVLANGATPSITGGSSSWSCPNSVALSGSTLFHCVGTGLKSTDTTYTASWTGSTANVGEIEDSIWATGSDAVGTLVNAAASTCIGATLTTNNANEPVITYCSNFTSGIMGTLPSGIVPLSPPGPDIGTFQETGLASGFEMKATAGTTSTRTWQCTTNCGSSAGGSMQVAQLVSTPVPVPTPSVKCVGTNFFGYPTTGVPLPPNFVDTQLCN